MAYTTRQKKKSAFPTDAAITNDSTFDFVKAGINKKAKWSDILDKIAAVYGLGVRLYEDQSAMVADTNLVIGDHAIVEGNRYALYEISNVAAVANDVTLSSGLVATYQGRMISADSKSYADLKSFNHALLKDGEIASLAYRASEDDGGGGQFRWDSSDNSANVTADPGQGIYVPPNSDTSGASGCWVRQDGGWALGIYSAAWFGFAEANSAATNTTALQNCINLSKVVVKTDISGKVVFVNGVVTLPAGIFNCNEVTSDTGIYIRGESMTSTQLVFANATSSTSMITIDDASDEIFGVLIEDISMDGQSSTGDGITIGEGIRVCGMNRVYIHSFNKNVTASNSFTFEMNRCYVRSATTINVELLTCTGGVLNSCRIDNAGTDNIYVTGGTFAFTNCVIQSAVQHGIHGYDAENTSVFNCFFEANDKNIAGTYYDIYLEDGVATSTRYLNVTGGYMTPGPGVTAGQKAGAINVERANLVSLDFDIKGNGYTTGFTGGANVKRAFIAGEFSSVGTGYSVNAATNLTDMTEPTDNCVIRHISDGVDSASYDQNDWQLQVGRSGNSFVGIGTHAAGRPALQGYGTGSSNKLLLNPEAGNVGVGNGAVNPGEKLVVDGLIRSIGDWSAGGLILNGSYLWVDATGDLRIKTSAPTGDTDGTVVGTQT